MKGFDTEQILTDSLKQHDANCRSIINQLGEMEIIASWKNTIWRILAKGIISNEEKILHLTTSEVTQLQSNAQKHNQTAAIAWVYPDGNIEYRSVIDNKNLRPRCLIKGKKIKKELYEQN